MKIKHCIFICFICLSHLTFAQNCSEGQEKSDYGFTNPCSSFIKIKPKTKNVGSVFRFNKEVLENSTYCVSYVYNGNHRGSHFAGKLELFDDNDIKIGLKNRRNTFINFTPCKVHRVYYIDQFRFSRFYSDKNNRKDELYFDLGKTTISLEILNKNILNQDLQNAVIKPIINAHIEYSNLPYESISIKNEKGISFEPFFIKSKMIEVKPIRYSFDLDIKKNNEDMDKYRNKFMGICIIDANINIKVDNKKITLESAQLWIDENEINGYVSLYNSRTINRAIIKTLKKQKIKVRAIKKYNKYIDMRYIDLLFKVK